MQTYQHEFLQLVIRHQILRFGQFTLKSGRISPYFFNAGLFNRAAMIADLGRFYAQAIIDNQIQFDMLFGPAYKGIPLVTASAIALATQHNMDYPFAFNRKEPKIHGEGGQLIGAPLQGRVLLIDDVISAGTAIREVLPLINASGACTVGVVVALDRQERGQGNLSAIDELQQEFGFEIISIITMQHIVEYISSDENNADLLQAMAAYSSTYGTQKS